MPRTHDIKARIYSVGHSTRPIDEFIEILKAYKLKLVIDVRKIPKSRHNPQYWGTRLAKSLSKHGIEYIQISELAGRRRPLPGSKNTAWRNRSFQGYADHMQTPEFQKGLRKLVSRSKRKRLVMMCAEAVPWRCHRSLISDALIAKDMPVVDIYSPTNAKPHKMTRFAKVRKGLPTYPGK